MVRTMLAAAVAMIVAALLNAATDKPQMYRNREFGITLPVPKGVLICRTPAGEHDHGPLMVLDRSKEKGCSETEGGRFVGVFASYNAADETKTLDKFLRSQCTDIAKGSCRAAPPDLQIRGMRSAAAKVNRSDGWIDIFVVTQAGQPDPAFDASVPSVNYALW